MNEQIFLNGAPAVGFGEGPLEAMSKVPLVGVIVGASGGSLLGYLVGKDVGGIVGALLGGIGGVIVENAVAKAAPAISPVATSSAATTPVWRQLLQPTDSVKAGEEMAIAILGPNRAPLSPDMITQLDDALALIPSYNATTLIGKYPPGSSPPSNDWPFDYVAPPGTRDDFGPGAYRVLIRALIDSPPTLWHSVPPNVATFGIWVR